MQICITKRGENTPNSCCPNLYKWSYVHSWYLSLPSTIYSILALHSANTSTSHVSFPGRVTQIFTDEGSEPFIVQFVLGLSFTLTLIAELSNSNRLGSV